MNSSTSNSTSSKPDFGDLLKIYRFTNSSEKVHGFLVKSTATINVEGDEDNKRDNNTENNANFEANQKLEIKEINYIAKILADAENPEVVIQIHGYSSKEDDVTEQYYSVVEYITKTQKIDETKTFVFFGYRWPSESPKFNLPVFLSALPILPRWILGGSFSGIIIFGTLILLQPFDKIPLIILLILFGSSSITFSIVITLILLRFSAYFRDSYRATNYAVSDLVELIRNLNAEIVAINNKKPDGTKKDYQKTDELNDKIELNFIGHSMGCYVTTNTIRILSDVFDPKAAEKKPTSYIGDVFSLNRLILVAPDIPVETIIPRRANFLQASLSRCEESYIFSNEGDVVLRIASTAANYFSFPARSLFSGYRLGNITVAHDHTKPIQYGIVNFPNLINMENDEPEDSLVYPFNWLVLRSSAKTSKEENITLKKLLSESQIKDTNKKKVPVTNKFTYFDCTDYEDEKKVTPVSLSARKQALGLWDYAGLVINHLFRHKIDTHGGYFVGKFSKELIYKLAFFGFEGLLKSYLPDAENKGISPLCEFSKRCKEKQIQVLLSPERMPESK